MPSRWTERLRRTLGFRLAVWYAAMFVGSSLAVAGLTYLLLASSLRERDHQAIEATLFSYATQFDQGGLPALHQAIRADQAAGRHGRLFVRVLAASQETIFFSLPSDWNDFDLAQLAPGSAGGRRWTNVPGRHGDKRLEVASVLLPDGSLVQVGRSTQARDEMLAHYRSVLLIVLAGIVAMGLAGGAVLTRWTMRPLRTLAGTVQTIVRTGRIDARVPVAGTADPLDELGGLFNGMLDRIAALITAMRGSLDNVAHDLRTPLTRLRATAERALQRDRDPEAWREALASCLEESAHVTTVLDALMDVSEAETGTMRLALAPVDVSAVVADAADLFADLADEKHVTVTVDAAPGLLVHADRIRLRQAIANLFENAVKYTPAGGRITALAWAEGGDAVIEIRDTGIGIAAEDLPRVWERLYRADRSRSERGLGLGLSLVRAIVLAHGGQVGVASTPGEGSTFSVRLPVQGLSHM